jgi:hypothetical protein
MDIGSGFFTSKVYVLGGAQDRTYHKEILPGVLWQDYDGLVSPVPVEALNVSPLGALSPSEMTNLLAAGATAIARCIPTNPVSGLANFLGELKRDGLPKAPGKSLLSSLEQGHAIRKHGSEYLNYEFAMLPTYNDLKSFARVAMNYDKVLSQYERDSGKGIRRRYSFPSIVTTETATQSGNPHGGPSWFNSGTLTTTTVKTVDRWFSGEFTYYLNLGQSDRDKRVRFSQEANKLLGTRLNVDLVWNLAPWSWAADWVTNVGDVFHNVSAFQADGLVMRYGYIMETTTIERNFTLDGYSLQTGVSGSLAPLTLRLVQQRKVRVPASPFGFGLTLSALSPRQIAIIAALGISRNTAGAK